MSLDEQTIDLQAALAEFADAIHGLDNPLSALGYLDIVAEVAEAAHYTERLKAPVERELAKAMMARRDQIERRLLGRYAP